MASVSHTRGVNLGSINKKYKVCIKKKKERINFNYEEKL